MASQGQAATKQIVILGAGFAGLPLAHRLLEKTAAAVKGLRIVLVSPSTHFYWNLAAVRGVIPAAFADDALFQPIAPGFVNYPSDQFEFVHGTAESIGLTKNTVVIETDAGTRPVPYDQLIVATGSSMSSGLPFKHIGSYQKTVSALHDLQGQVEAAQSIVIAGGGPTGVETAGEIAYAYPDKEVTLIVDKDRVLQGIPADVGQLAERYLKEVNVKLIHEARATEIDAEGTRTKVTLSNGTALSTDLYLPLFGVKPNTEFMPPHLLDDQGSLKMDPTLRVSETRNVWALGDAANIESKQALKLPPQVDRLAANLDAVLTGREEAVREYTPNTKPQMFITVCKRKGTGTWNGWKLPGFVVTIGKGRTLLTERLPGMVRG